MSKWSPEWEVASLREIAEFRNGINYSSANEGHGIKIIGVSNFQNNLYVPYDELSEINPDGVIRDEDLLQENDFVFVRSNGNRDLIGRSLHVRDLPGNVTHSGFTIRLRFTTNQALPEFFAQILRSEITRDAISNLGSGTNISNLSQQILGGLEVPLPPMEEQRKIAAILSTWDEAIGLTEALIAALGRRKQALMQVLLTGEVRFQEFEGDWEEAHLRDVSRVQGGYAFKSDDFDNDGIPLIRISNIVGGDVVIDENTARLPTDFLKEYASYVLHEGDILIAMSGATTGKFGVYRHQFPALLNQRVGRFLALGERLHIPFLHYHLPRLQKQILEMAYGGAQPNISSDDIGSFTIDLPPNQEQEKMSGILQIADEELGNRRELVRRLQTQKRGLMQQLLTGAVRV